MPLPPPVPREELHLRRIELRGYRRDDGLYEIEGRVVDTKSHPMRLKSVDVTVPAGAAMHDMSVRMVLDDDLLVHDVMACTDSSPYPACPEAAASLGQLRGQRIGAGFNRFVRENLSGARSCTHLVELLVPIATTAFQTLSPVRNAGPERLDKAGKPVKIDSCYAYAANGDIVRRHWPEFHK